MNLTDDMMILLLNEKKENLGSEVPNKCAQLK
jgi:hypothetical protein